MTNNLEQNLNFEPLFDSLIEKTRAGKISWLETADESTFLAAVKGIQTIELTLEVPRGRELGHFPKEAVPVVKVKDGDGKLVYKTPNTFSSSAEILYDLATRVGRNVDEKVDGTLQLLNKL